LALNFRLAVNMLQLIYALKKHNNWLFPTPPQSRISFERAIHLLLQMYGQENSKTWKRYRWRNAEHSTFEIDLLIKTWIDCSLL
jgi:hypothetical protein